MTDAVRGWLEERRDDVPAEFLPWLERDDLAAVGESDVLRGLERRALIALSEAASGPPSDRRTAFRLLAADAFLTYACEAALERPDPESALRELFERVGERIP